MNDLGDDFEFFEPEDKFGTIKASVHKSGKLGFSAGAIKLIDFEKNKFFKIARKKDSPNVLFLFPIEAADEYTFKVSKAGDYYYLKIKRLLSQLNIDYRNEKENLSYDIDEVKEEGKRYFKLVQRKKKANNT